MNNDKLQNIRRDYKNEALTEKQAGTDPFVLFDRWLQAILACDSEDPTTMVLSTVDANQKPDSRVVLLKAVTQKKFVFYTNYSSHKGIQLNCNPFAALNFYWPSMCRQVRIRGVIDKLSLEDSSKYFASRPRDSQIAALASKQSHVVTREELDNRFKQLNTILKGKAVECPNFWGGYALTPFEFEFWHGRQSRLHDRLHFELTDNNAWHLQRLAP